MKTYASSAANRCAVARLMPLLPPVMNATFPSSFPTTFSFGFISGAQFIGSVLFSEQVRCVFRITRGKEATRVPEQIDAGSLKIHGSGASQMLQFAFGRIDQGRESSI